MMYLLRLSLTVLILALPGRLLAQATTLTHSTSLEVTDPGIACGNSGFGFTGENHYWRVFDLAAFGVVDDYTIASIDLGIGDIDLRGTSQPSTLRIHKVDGDFVLANLTLLHEEEVEVRDDLAMTLLNVPLDDVTIAAGSVFAVEWEPPNGTPNDDHGPLEITFGANNAGQTGPTYIYAPSCGDIEPMDLATVGPGFPDAHWVLAVHRDVSTAIAVDVVPASFALGQNYPNPFNPTTIIPFSLQARSFVDLRVFDLHGKEVATLLRHTLSPGAHETAFDAADLPSGVYFYRLAVDGHSQMKSLLLLK